MLDRDAVLARAAMQSSFHFSAGQRAVSARARLEEARVMLDAGDPACRELLEDVGTVFEELGDMRSVLEIDALLRRAADVIEETPRSFHFRAAASLSS